MDYRTAPEIEEMAAGLIPVYHGHLLGLRVSAVFTDKTATSKGKKLFGRARKISGINEFLARQTGSTDEYGYSEPFFVLEASEEVWIELTPQQRIALVDHLLCQCEITFNEETGDATLSIVSPNVMEFSAILERHGIWQPDLRHLSVAPIPETATR